jgi:hypothetical protein
MWDKGKRGTLTMKVYENIWGDDADDNEPVAPTLWTINLVGREEIPGGDSLSSALIILGQHIAMHGLTVLLIEVRHEDRTVMVALEARRWFVVVSGDGRFADGFYGWDGSLHSSDQIFAEEDLPYSPSTPDIRNVFICTSLYKPSLDKARDAASSAAGG